MGKYARRGKGKGRAALVALLLTLDAGLVIISCADRGMADQLERLIRSAPAAP